jgi:hypothetical protein
MEQPDLSSDNPRNASHSVDIASVHWGLAHPDEDVDHAPPSAPAEDDEVVPNRHSASAEAALLRWQELHPDDS